MAKTSVKLDLPYGSGRNEPFGHICRVAHAPLANLKQLRGSMTLEEVSEQSGVSLSQLSRYERGGDDGRDPKLTELRKLAGLFNSSVSHLIGEASPPRLTEDQLYKGQPKDSDRIQVEVGVLRTLISEALREEGVEAEQALAYADGVIGSLLKLAAEPVALCLAVSARSDP